MRPLVSALAICLLLATTSGAAAGTILGHHFDDPGDFDNFGDLVKHLAQHGGYDDSDLDGDHDLFDHHGPVYTLIQLVDAQHPGKHLGHYLHGLHHFWAALFHHHPGHPFCDVVDTTPPPVTPSLPSFPPLPNIGSLPGPSGEPPGELDFQNADADVSVAPEPASLAIWGLGALGCAAYGYRRKKRAA